MRKLTTLAIIVGIGYIVLLMFKKDTVYITDVNELKEIELHYQWSKKELKKEWSNIDRESNGNLDRKGRASLALLKRELDQKEKQLRLKRIKYRTKIKLCHPDSLRFHNMPKQLE